MQIKNKDVGLLLDHYRGIALLGKTESLLNWDSNVNLPPKASDGRAEQIAYLTSIITDKWQDKDFRGTLESLSEKSKGINPLEQAIVRNLTHASKFYYRVPKGLIVKFSETTSKSFIVWQSARSENNFNKFLPHLEKVIDLNIEIARHLGYKENPYDALLDLYERGLTAKECESIFDHLKLEVGQILSDVKSSKRYKEESKGREEVKQFAKADQEKVSIFVLEKIGYDFDSGRMDESTHPFTSNFGHNDVRVTNRYNESNFVESIMVALHEGGHALYEQGVDPMYDNTPLGGGVSLGIHESQSRFWENQVGRSEEFIHFITPILKSHYPDQLRGIGKEEVLCQFNRVKPSLIRTEADEVTYNLHIALRFELENNLLNKKIKASDLPEIWRTKMKSYLGIVPETDSEGVLQDVHWSYGNFGYFPTYTLGNLYAAQFTHFMNKDLDLSSLTRNGDFAPILSWQRETIHRHGSLYLPKELVKRVTGKPLSPEYFIKYLRRKYSKLYLS